MFIGTLSISAADTSQELNLTNSDMQDIENNENLLAESNTNNTLNTDIGTQINSTDYVELNPGEYNISNITINKNITIKGNGSPEEIIINGENSGNAIFTTNGTGITIKFENITFINGYNDVTTGAGAIDNYYANVLINNCIFMNNRGYEGGAVSSQEGNLTITNSTFISNRADHDGGAIKSDYYNTLYVENSYFTKNYAERDGGCIGSTRLSNAYINNCTFENNTASEWAGVLYNWASTMYVNNSVLNNNLAKRYYGGAIMTSGPLYINNSVITNNRAAETGGAICIKFEIPQLPPSLSMENSCIFNNTAYKGNDIYIDTGDYSTAYNIDNNWWGANNPINSTDYLYNWSSRIQSSKDLEKTINSWINMETTVTNDTIMVQAKYNNGSVADNFIINEKVIFLNSTKSHLNNGIATYTFTSPLNMLKEITRVDYQTYPYKTQAVIQVLSKTYRYFNGNTYNADNYTIQLKDANGNVLANQKISFKIVGKIYNRTTDENGIASLPIRLNAKTYNITVLYNGTYYINKTSLSQTITVQKNSVQISAKNIVKRRNYYVVTIKSNNKPVIGKKVVISVCGKNYYRITDKNGQVRLKINLKPNTYTIKTTFYSTNNLNKKTLTQKLTVKK